MNVKSITFDGEIGEDWILHINNIQILIIDRLPNGERTFFGTLWDIISWPFRKIGKLIDVVTAFFGIGWKGFMWIGITVLLILAWKIISPIITLIGTFLSMFASGVKNIASSVSSKKDKKGNN
jgi:hypothetical protein